MLEHPRADNENHTTQMEGFGNKISVNPKTVSIKEDVWLYSRRMETGGSIAI